MERDLIRERTLDGLAAAEAQGRKVAAPALDPDPSPSHVGAARAGRVGDRDRRAPQDRRSTLYRALQPDQTSVLADADPPTPYRRSGGRCRVAPGPRSDPAPDEPVSPAERELRERLVRQSEMNARHLVCPTCGSRAQLCPRPGSATQDLEITWLYPDPASQLRVVERVHCSSCHPTSRSPTVVCQLCGGGPLLAGELADAATDELPPAVVRTWLTTKGWQISPRLMCQTSPPADPARPWRPAESFLRRRVIGCFGVAQRRGVGHLALVDKMNTVLAH